MKNHICKLFLSLLSVCLFSISNLSAVPDVNLGRLHIPDPPPTGSDFNGNYPVSHAFDGAHDNPNEAWQGNPAEGFIRWNVAPFHTVNADTAIYDSLRITVNIYNGGGTGLSPQIGNLNSFRIRVLDGSGGYRLITDFHNLESTFVESGIMAGFPLSISHNNEWITATNNLFADGQSMHSITFSTSSELSQIEILTNADSSVGTGFFSIDEIETFGVAVPEPSSYALLLGASLLLFRLSRNTKSQLPPNN